MTSGSPAKLIFLFTVPLFIGNLFQQLYNMADTFIVGQTLGVDALAAVGCTGSLTFLIIGFAQGLCSGFSIVTAQRFGAEDAPGVRRSFASALLLSGVISVVLTAVSTLCARKLLTVMQTPPEILDGAAAYLTVVFAGIPATMLFNALSNTLRALGDSRTPLYFLVVACLFNIVLDYVLILYTPLGVAGAGVATVAAQLLSGLACLWYIFRRFPMLMLTREDWRLSARELRAHLSLGLPIGFQSSIIAIGSVMLQFALNGLGSVSVAAYTAASKIESLGSLPLMSIGVATGTYVAQNYGAGQTARIRTGVLQAGLMAVVFSAAVGAGFLLFGAQLSRLFVGSQPEAVDLAAIYLRVSGCSLWVLGLLFVFRYTLQGLGQAFVPTFAGVMELIMRSAGSLVLIAPLGFTGACLANISAWVGSAVPLTIAFFLTMRRLAYTGRCR